MFVLKVLLLSLFLTACGGGGSGGGSSNSVTSLPVEPVEHIIVNTGEEFCLANKRNCSDADVDLNTPVRCAADKGISIVHIRWAGCSDDASSKYAYERGVTIICLAGYGGREITHNSPYTITVGSAWKYSNYGPGIDYTIFESGTIHSGIYATALTSIGEPLGDYQWEGYTKIMHLPAKTVMIVDNGFDYRPLYVLHKNPMLAGEITGDYGVKALNELSRWVDVDVIGYVPFNTKPTEPRIDNWKII